MNEKKDKKVWLLWMEGRVHEEYGAIKTPVGFIPKYEDLKALFQQIFSQDYTEEEYKAQFSIRTQKLAERFKRIMEVYKQEPFIPKVFIDHLNHQINRLKEAKEKLGDVITPDKFVESE